MRVLLINATMRQQSTYHMARAVLEGLPAVPEVREIFLPRDLPAFCTGCGNCFLKGEEACPHFQYTRPIWASILWADLLVFANPVYVYHVTGGLKNLLDHFGCHWMVHRPDPLMFKKQAVIVTAAAGAGMRSAEKDLLDTLPFWGVGNMVNCRVRTRAMSWNKIPAARQQKLLESARTLAKRVQEPGSVRQTPAGRMRFRVLGKLIGGLTPYDKAYWKKTF